MQCVGLTRTTIMRRIVTLSIVLRCTAAARAEDPPKGIKVDKDKKTIVIDAKMAPRKLEDPKFKDQQWPIEVIACWSFEKKGQKAHETVVTIDDVKPSDVHK